MAPVDGTLAAALARATDPASVQHTAVCDDLQRFATRWRAVAPRRAPVHPLLARHAASHGHTGLPQVAGEGRLASLANSSRIFHMTHIAKTGGRSVRAELMQLVRPVGGAEQCYPPFMHASRVNIIFFREPRAHALSQYLHGATVGREKANAKWLRRKAAGYPMGDGAEGLTGGLALWAAHFARGWSPARGDFFSYNPLNMMARRPRAKRVLRPPWPAPLPPAPWRSVPRQRRRGALPPWSLAWGLGRRGALGAVEPWARPAAALQPPRSRRCARCCRAGTHADVQGRALELRLRQDLRGVYPSPSP